MPKPKLPPTPTDDEVRALLARYQCPVPFHAVRTRFLGNIATPAMQSSPMDTVAALWCGEMPVFESLDATNELIGALVMGLWNRLTRHQERSAPFRLTRIEAPVTREETRAIGLEIEAQAGRGDHLDVEVGQGDAGGGTDAFQALTDDVQRVLGGIEQHAAGAADGEAAQAGRAGDLIAWYNQTIREHPWPLLVATEFVFRFLAIHPFQDGNGRLGRALFLLALMQGDDPDFAQIIRFISIDRQIERHRPLYYAVLRQASGGRFHEDARLYQFEGLATFFLKMLENALADVAILRRRYAALQRLSESAVTVLACFKSAPERRLKLADLVTETGLVRRTVQNALVSLIEAGVLHRLGAGPGTRYQLIF
jgi:hypothetical protein